MKFLRTIRFDATDDNVFERAAEPGEWAVPGAFEFADMAPGEVTGKTRQAFANGFLGLGSFGRSTFVSTAKVSDADLAEIERTLAQHFVDRYGAPDVEAAMPAARAEAAFVLEMCEDVLLNTVFAIRRNLDEAAGVHEEFRLVEAEGAAPVQHARIWKIVEDDE